MAAVSVVLPIPATVGGVSASGNVLSDNTTGAKFDGLDLSFGGSTTPKVGRTEGSATTVIKDGKKQTVKGRVPGVNGLFAVFSGSLRFSLAANSWKGSITFSLPSIGGVSGSFDVINGVVRQLAVNATYTAPGLPHGANNRRVVAKPPTHSGYSAPLPRAAIDREQRVRRRRLGELDARWHPQPRQWLCEHRRGNLEHRGRGLRERRRAGTAERIQTLSERG